MTIKKHQRQSISFIIAAFITLAIAVVLFGNKKNPDSQKTADFMTDGDKMLADHDFSKGVLAVNFPKNLYKANEQVAIQLSSLDSKGQTLCNSNLQLVIINSQGAEIAKMSTAEKSITKSPTCSPDNNVTNEADYLALFIPTVADNYTVKLTNTDTGLTVSNIFEVSDQLETLDVQRWSATRINPEKSDRYPMAITVTANEDYDGKFEEILPPNFELAWQGPATVSKDDKAVKLTWDVNLKKGEVKELKYEYKAPKVSPYFYVLKTNADDAKENLWQIASDAIAVRAETTGTDTTNGFTVTRPTTATGDYIVVIVGAEDEDPAVAPPSGQGWVTGDWSGDTTGNDRQIGIFYKYVTDGATEASSYNFTSGVNDDVAWWVGSLSGIDAVTPEDETMSGNSVLVSDSATPAAPAISTVTAGAFVLAGWAMNFDNTTTLPGGSWASRADDVNSGAVSLDVVSQTFAGTGSTGSVSISGGTATMETQTGQWAFRPLVPDSFTGIAYTDDGSTVDTTASICAVVNNGTPACASTNGSGVFTINTLASSSGDQVTFFFDGGTEFGNTITVSDGGDIVTGDALKVFQNTVFVRYETGSNINITQMDAYDNDQNSTDMLFDAEDASPDTVTLESNVELHINTSMTFAPGGNVTTQGTGKIHVDDNGVFTGAGSEAHVIGGQLAIDTGAVFTAPTSGTVSAATINMVGTLTAGGSTITLNGTSGTLFTNSGTFTEGTSTLVFNPNATVILFSTTDQINNLELTPTLSSSGKTYSVGAALTITGNLTINPTAASSLALTVEMGGDISVASGKTTTITGTTSGTSILDLRPLSTDYNLTTGLLNIATAGTLDGTSASSTITLSGTSGTLFTRAGTFNAGSTTVTATSASGSPTLNSGTITFFNLTIDPSSANTITASSDDITVTNTVNVASSDTLSLPSGQDLTHSGSTLTLNGTISGAGRYIYQSSTTFPTTGTFSAVLRMDSTNTNQVLGQRTYGGDTEVYNNSSGSARTVTLGTASSQTLTFSGSLLLLANNTQNVTLDGATRNPTVNVTGDLDYTGSGGGTEVLSTGTGTWTVSGNVDFTGGSTTVTAANTLKMNGSSKTLTTATVTLQNFEVSGGSVTTVGATDINGTFSVSSGTFTQSATTNLNIAGNFTLSTGITFTKSTSGLLIFDGDLTYTDSTSGLQDVGDVQIGASPDTTNLASDFKANSLTVTSADVFNSNGYDLDIGTGGISISGTFDATDDVETDETIINCAGNFAINSGATFTQNQSSLIMDANSGTKTLITDGSFSLYVLEIAVNAAATVEVQDALDVDSNLTITSGSLDVVSSENNQINVGGNWANSGTFVERSGKVVLDGTTSTTLNSGCTDVTSCTTQNFYDLEMNKTSAVDANDNVTLSSNGIRLTNTLTITDGELIQSTLNVQAEGSSSVSIASAGKWTNTSTGDLTLGGSFANAGTATFQGNGTSCGDADDITIASTAAAQRSWTGSGTFDVNDVSVSYQAGSASISAFSSTDGGNNGANWSIYSGCSAPGGSGGSSIMTNLDGRLDLEKLDIN
jgi:hypothetical protein